MDERKRHWEFVFYEDSAPDNWLELLERECVPMFISPSHNADVDENGELKKPHRHVIIMFSGKQPQSAAQRISDLLSAKKVFPVRDIIGVARYLCHLDNPTKARYDIADVIALSGADYLEKIQKTADTDSILWEIMDWCIANRCWSLFSLSNYAKDNRSDWFRVISTQRTVFLAHWLKSMHWELTQNK